MGDRLTIRAVPSEPRKRAHGERFEEAMASLPPEVAALHVHPMDKFIRVAPGENCWFALVPASLDSDALMDSCRILGRSDNIGELREQMAEYKEAVPIVYRFASKDL